MTGDVRFGLQVSCVCSTRLCCVCAHGVLCHQHVSVFVYVHACALNPNRMVGNHGTVLFPDLYEFHD